MATNHQWSILWPRTLTKELAEKGILMQFHQSSSQILISNQRPKVFYTKVITEKPDLCQTTYLEVKFEKDLIDKNYRLELQDNLCFMAEEYSCNQSNQICWEFKTSIVAKQKNDFSRFLMDILVFFHERFNSKFRKISIFIEAPNFDLKNTLDFLKTSNSHPFFGLSYFPYYCEKQGLDTLKTSFLWKPWVSTVLLADAGFDFKTEVTPGEGITPNKSACQISLENKKKITFIFKPNSIVMEEASKMEEFLMKCENFISSLSL